MEPMQVPPALALKPLDAVLAAAPATPSAGQREQLVEQTQKWVAQTFFGTLMKQMEDSPFKSDLFSGGRGGEAFSSLYHQQLVDRMARAAGDKLVNAIVRRIEATAAYQKQQPSNPNARRDVPAAPRA